MTRYDYRDRTAASPNPLKEAEAKASELAGALRKLSIQEMNQGVGNRVAATVQRVNDHVSSLEAALAGVHRSPNEKSAQALDDAFFVIDGQIEDLFTGIKDWASRAEAAMKGVKALRPTVKETIKLCRDGVEWARPVIKQKGSKKLGTPWKWEMAEVTQRGVTYQSYIATTPLGKFRISPEDRHEGASSGWVVDKGGVGLWEQFIPKTFRSPTDAAAALVERVGSR
jgi:hypothetical protein